MPGSIRLHLELSPEDADKIYAATQRAARGFGYFRGKTLPSDCCSPDEEQRSQLLILLDRVKETWVDGVLRNSIYNEALISLGKRPIEEAVEPPWKHVVELSSQRSQFLLKDRNISTIFDATGLLLILGEPGSGKTTTLLDLAATLIARSKGRHQGTGSVCFEPLKLEEETAPGGVDLRGAFGEISSAGQNSAFLVAE